MNEQRQHGTRQEELLPGPETPDEAAAAERLAASRHAFDRIYAAASPIIEEIRQGDNQRFLEQVRQTGGE